MPDPAETAESGNAFAQLGVTNLGSGLVDILLADSIVPGSPPSYSTCKTLYSFHPLGQKIAEGPITMAQSQDREITIPGAPESRLIDAFRREWRALGTVGADALIKQTMTLARVYGIASLGIGDRKRKPSEPLKLDELHDADLYFNIWDPLNTAGSLVLNQDPNAPDFQKPTTIRVAGQEWHPSRSVVMMNEQPVYIEFTPSAFGFVGRSVYQRALFPLKSYINSLIADDMVMKKIALLIWKAKSPSSAINNRMMQMFSFKRQNLQSAVNGNVLTIGHEEDINSLNFQNLEGAGRFTRENILKNIAVAAGGMPAAMLHMETLTEGFGEGTEDAKQIARFIDRIRIEMQPLYASMDTIVQRRAWTPGFYEGIQREYPEYRKVLFESAFYEWRNAFRAAWPNLLVEPDSEKVQVDKVRFEAVVGMIEVLAPLVVDPENRATLAQWAADQANDRKELFSSPLLLDEEAMREYRPPMPPAGNAETKREPEPRAFSYET